MPYFQDETTEKSGYAGFWWRVLSYLIDAIILAIVAAIIDAVASLSTDGRIVVAVVLAFVYGTSLIATKAQTIGMMITRLHVESADGAKITLNQAGIRAGFYSMLLLISNLYHHKSYANPTPSQTRHELHDVLIQVLFAAPALLDGLWILWDKRKQTLHDKVAKTVVKR
jgi:uncharacterized RDD family membrane protein YckC